MKIKSERIGDGIRAAWRDTSMLRKPTAGTCPHAKLEVARQEGLEPPTHSLEGCRSIQLSYWRNGRTGALPPSAANRGARI